MIRLMLLMLLLLTAGPAFAETRFFDELGDVPVMPALSELSERTVIFDKPQGRIAQVMALKSGVAAGAVDAFYADSLPQFGWQKQAPGRYSREGQILTIMHEREDGRDLVIFRVEPR